MISMKESMIYKGFGLNISSEIPLPELLTVKLTDNVDVVIQKDDLFCNKYASLSEKQNYIVYENEVTFKVSDTAIFSIKDGNKIVVSPMPGSEENKIRLFILGTCMAIILMQRKTIPIHGSAIAINGKAYGFVGHRGSGKSTLASAFLKRGYKLLTDDIIAVTLDEGNHPYVIPSYPQQKLWEDSLIEFKIDTDQLQPLFERETKYAVPVKDYCADSLPLGGIFELVKTNNDQICISPIQKLEILHTLYVHTFRQFLLNDLGLRQWHFSTITNFANEVDMFQVSRGTSTFTANEIVTLTLNLIKREGLKDDRNSEIIIGK